jgi:putative restriction endonuclease
MRLNAFVAITDTDWFEFLSQLGPLDEVNFWQPSPRGSFRSVQIGEPLLFKLHSPNDVIVGGGFFSHWTSLPASLVWEAFGEKNGARSFSEMRTRIDRYRKPRPAANEDPAVGCVVLLQPFFLQRSSWIPVPEWHREIVRGKTVDLGTEPWQSVWERVVAEAHLAENQPRYGDPRLVVPRLGQGAFRVLVTDAYGRRCAVTGEKVLPVLHAAHIRPYTDGGEHRIDNGILLRSDFHILFDRGYVTVTPQYELEVSRKLRAEFHNGEEYLRWHGQAITVPQPESERPSPEFLSWHNEHRFVGS